MRMMLANQIDRVYISLISLVVQRNMLQATQERTHSQQLATPFKTLAC